MDRKREILQHTLGDRTCWRNRYYLYEDSDDYAICQDMVFQGLMTSRETPDWFGGGTYFYATDKGKGLAWADPEGAER